MDVLIYNLLRKDLKGCFCKQLVASIGSLMVNVYGFNK